MKINLRWQVLLAVVAFALVIALLSFQVQSASFCSTRVPAAGGAFVEGVVGAPQNLNPLLSDPYPVDRELTSLIFDGLTRYDAAGELVPALAEGWTVGEDGLSVRFTLRDDVFWQDGEPVTAVDVLYTFHLLQDESFPGPAALSEFWRTITINQIDERTVEFVLPEPYSPFLDATTRGLLPAHLLEDVTAAELAGAAFNLAPVGTGPFMVDPAVNWQANGRLRLIPNPADWRQGTQLSALEFQFFPDEATLLDAFNNGDIHAINRVSATALPAVAVLPEARLFTAPEPTYSALWFNLRQPADETYSELGRTLSGRQALAAALDRQGLVDTAVNGQGLVFNGPYLPSSWAYNPGISSNKAYDPATAASLLETAGWTFGAEQTVRQKDGRPLSLTLIALDDPQETAVAETIRAQWAAVGIDTQIRLAQDLAELRQWLADGLFDVALLTFTPSGDPDLYDFWSQEAIIRGQNYTGWNNRRASEALEQGRQVWGMEERRPSYDTFLRYFDQEMPALTLFQDTYTYALSTAVNNAEIGLINQPRDRYKTLAEWFLLYRDVAVACPSGTVD
ncbi:MAG: peptide ABC transporter substrate-binding protein [Ardenticatenaceae bacterium]|nr:peptide ABC transporter substrate-binding protein [Ardenticatenaceae bacterium]MCB8986471.1 peptide ABC transporter substrate-binding protein [Ardenticatenaceae bacterium]